MLDTRKMCRQSSLSRLARSSGVGARASVAGRPGRGGSCVVFSERPRCHGGTCAMPVRSPVSGQGEVGGDDDRLSGLQEVDPPAPAPGGGGRRPESATNDPGERGGGDRRPPVVRNCRRPGHEGDSGGSVDAPGRRGDERLESGRGGPVVGILPGPSDRLRAAGFAVPPAGIGQHPAAKQEVRAIPRAKRK